MPNNEEVSTMTPNGGITTPSTTASGATNDYSQISQDGTGTTATTTVPSTQATKADQSNVMTTQDNTQATQTTQSTDQNVNQNITPNSSSVVAQRPSDFVDNTVNQYYMDYQVNSQNNNLQGEINALTSIDDYRIANGYAPIYTSTIYDLTNERNTEIENEINRYQEAINLYNQAGNTAAANQLQQQMDNYMVSVGRTPYTVKRTNVANLTESEYLATTPEYRNYYLTGVEDIVRQLTMSSFTYDPSKDAQLHLAQEYAKNSAMESMNSRGILDSTMTAAVVTNAVNQLIPEFRKMAYNEWKDSISIMQSTANLLLDMDSVSYSRYKDEISMALEYYSSLRREAEYQWERVEQLGYVDNIASAVLGVTPGTLSKSARESAEAFQRQVSLAWTKATIEKDIIQYQADLEAQYTNTKNGNLGLISDNSFKGELSAETLRTQANNIIAKMGKSYDDPDVEDAVIEFLRVNAKDYNAFVSALTGNTPSGFFEPEYKYDLSSALNLASEQVYKETVKPVIIKDVNYLEAAEGLADIYKRFYSNYDAYTDKASEYLQKYNEEHDLKTTKPEVFNRLMREFLPLTFSDGTEYGYTKASFGASEPDSWIYEVKNQK